MDISDRVGGVEALKRVLFTMVVESLVVAMAAMEAGKLLACLLSAVESASSEGGVWASGEVDELIKGTRVVPGKCKGDLIPENKDAGDSDGDDDDDEEDEDEDGGDQDDGGDEELSGDEGDDKDGDDDVKDPTVNGEGGSDDDDDEDDDDDDDDDDEDADEDDEDEDDEEEDEEPPSKKKK